MPIFGHSKSGFVGIFRLKSCIFTNVCLFTVYLGKDFFLCERVTDYGESAISIIADDRAQRASKLAEKCLIKKSHSASRLPMSQSSATHHISTTMEHIVAPLLSVTRMKRNAEMGPTSTHNLIYVQL